MERPGYERLTLWGGSRDVFVVTEPVMCGNRIRNGRYRRHPSLLRCASLRLGGSPMEGYGAPLTIYCRGTGDLRCASTLVEGEQSPSHERGRGRNRLG